MVIKECGMTEIVIASRLAPTSCTRSMWERACSRWRT